MNRLEFTTVLRKFEIICKKEDDSKKEYICNNISMYLDKNDTVVINGKIPLEVANILYKKYPNNKYGIRIDGQQENGIPSDYAVDKIYIEQTLYDANESIRQYANRCKEATKEFQTRPDKDKYLTKYIIDTKEGLVIFLSEIKDYYARINEEKETYVDNYNEIIEDINRKILEQSKMNITTYEWMASDEKNKAIFFDKIHSQTKTSFGRCFRMVLDEFDATINPYLNKEIELSDINNYLDNVDVTFDSYDELNGEKRPYCVSSCFIDKKTKSKACYHRRIDGFSYVLTYKLESDKDLIVAHYYTNSSPDENENGEVIAINYYDEYAKREIDIRYNITKGFIGPMYSNKTAIKPEQKELIYDQLIRAISLASTITINNMEKNQVKKLVK